MVDVVFSLGRLFVAFFLVVLNGFFVASEFALVRVRSTSVERLVEEGKPGADTLSDAMANLDDFLAATQLGITLASLGLGWIGEPAVAALIEPFLGAVLPESLVHLAAFALGFGFITFLHVVFGELAPKTIAIAEAERMALLLAPPMKLFYYIFVPGIVVFNGTANFFTSLIGIEPASESEETLQEEEILMVLSHSGKQGHVDREEVEMIERVFELDDITVSEVMVPRPDVVSVPADMPLTEIRSVILAEGHTRYPVVEVDDQDQIVGFIDAKDVLRASESVDEAGEPVTAGDIAREMTVVPETTRVNDLLLEFQRDHSQMAAVIDEWGSLDGIATVEDVVEVIVGDIQDQFDEAGGEPSIDELQDGAYAVDGGVALAAVNETVGTTFESDEFGTLGGLVLDSLGRAPEVGDEVEADGYRLAVEGVDGARVTHVVLRELDEAESTG
ncbi:hemolysin family protein [Halobacterium wangiae]|uniref:hemolysin family protein n=1 Tax=Halobacterium wangiae TaxID=2902623 RepID=UPI001E291128|nr:hemolysin family protein [Halobacterium wangiae]